MNKDFGQLRFLKSDDTGGKVFPLKAECCSIGSSMNASIRLMDKGHGLLGIHCIIDVDKNGVATLSNKAPINPVKLNGQNILKKRCLKPGDVLTIMDKRLRYENENIEPEILSSIDKVRNIKTPRHSRMSLVDFRKRRSAMTPEPKRPRRPQIKRKRSNSFSNIQEFDIIAEDDIQDSPFKTPGRRKSIRVKMANSSFLKSDVSTSQLLPSKEISTPSVEQKFQVVTPQSTIKPSLRSELLKSLGKPKLPELVKPSEESELDDIEKRELRTPVAEILDSEDLINFNTPVNNTSIVDVDSPDEENVPVRSKKSLTKNISIQRLTQNDDSIVVLDSPNSKTPKSMLRAKPKTPSTTLKKTNLISEMEKESFSSTPIVETSAISKQVQFESLRKSMRGSAASTPDASPKKMYPKTPRRNVPGTSAAAESSESEEDNFKTPNNNTPVLSKSTMKQRRSTVKMTDADTTPKAVSPTSVPKSRRSFRNFDSMISDKSSNSSAQSNESLDMPFSTEAIINSEVPDSTSNEEGLKYLNSAKSIEYLNESVSELSMKDDSHSPVPNMPKRRAVTEQKVTKPRGHKRRSLNLSLEMNQGELCEESTSSVDTSSFIYIPGDSSKLNSPKASPTRSVKGNEELETNSSMEIDHLNVSENSLEEENGKDELTSPKNQKSDDSSEPKDEKTPKVENDLRNMSGIKGVIKTPKPDTLIEANLRKVKFVESSDTEQSIPCNNQDLSLEEKNISVICETPVQDCRRSSVRSLKKVPEIVITKTTPLRKSRLDLDEQTVSLDLVVESPLKDVICTTPVPEHQENRRSVRSIMRSVESPEVSTPVLEESNVNVYLTPKLDVRRQSVRSSRKSIVSTETPQRRSVIVKDTTGVDTSKLQLQDEEDDDINTNEVIDSPTANSPQNEDEDDEFIVVDVTPVQEKTVRKSRSTKKSIDTPNATPRRKSRALEVVDTPIAKIVEEPIEAEELVKELGDEHSTPMQEMQVIRKSLRSSKKIVDSPSTKSSPQRKSRALGDISVIQTKIPEELNETEGILEEVDENSTPVKDVQVRRQSVRTAKKDVGSPALKSTPQGNSKAFEDTSVFETSDVNESEGIVEQDGNSSPVQEIQVRRQSRSTTKDIGSPAVRSMKKSKATLFNTPILESRRKSTRSTVKVISSPIAKSTTSQRRRLMDKPLFNSPKPSTSKHQFSDVVQDLIASPTLVKNTPVQDILVRRVSVRSAKKAVESPRLTPQKRRTLLNDMQEAELINKNVENVKESALTPTKNDAPNKEIKSSTPKSSVEDKELEVHTPENCNATGNEDEFLTPAFLLTTKERRRTIKSAKRMSLASLTLSAKKRNIGVLNEFNVSTNETEINPENDLKSPKVVKQLIKTPKHQALDDLSNALGVEQLMDSPKEKKDFENDPRSPKVSENDPRSPKARKELNSPIGVKTLQREPLNDLSNPMGVKKLLRTPKVQKGPNDDLSNPLGVKQLMKTPKLQNEPLNDLSSPRGVKQLLTTPKVQNAPKDDLRNPLGVKQLMRTPKVQNEPLNDLSSPRGVKQLLATPKVQNEPKDDLRNPLGVKQLMKTPKVQNEPLNDLSSPRGVKQLLKTPKAQKGPKNDLTNPLGVKQLMKTPKPQNEPLNDLSSPRGVKQLLRTPKAQNDPKDDLTNPFGVKQLMASPRVAQNEHTNDLTSPQGVKDLFALHEEPESNSEDARVQELFHVSSTTDLNVSGVELLVEDEIFPKPLRTYAKSLTPRKSIKEDSLNVSSSTEKDMISALTTPDASSRKRKTIIDDSETEDVEVNKSVKRAKSASHKNKEIEPQTPNKSKSEESLNVTSHNKSTDSVRSTSKRSSRLSTKNQENEATTPKSVDAQVDNDSSINVSVKSSKKVKTPKDKTSTPTAQSRPVFEIPITPIRQEKTPRRGRAKKNIEELSAVDEQNVESGSAIIEDQTNEIKTSASESLIVESTKRLSKDVEDNEVKPVRSTRRGRKAAEEPVIKPVRSTRRGRKATEVESDVNDQEVVVDTPVKLVRGRKAKEPAVDKDASLVSLADEPVKTTRRNGRKAKKQDLEDDNESKTVESIEEDKALESTIEVKTTRRGKKVVEEQTAEDESKPVVKVTRRGRKADEVIELLVDDDDDTETSADTSKQVKTTRTGKKAVEDQSVEDGETKSIDALPVKATRRGRKAVEPKEDVDAKPEKITRRGKKAVEEAVEEDTSSVDLKPPTRRGRKAAEVKTVEKVTRGRNKQAADDTDLEDVKKEEEQPKRAVRGGRKAKSDNQPEEAERPKRAASRKAVHFQDDDKNEEESAEEGEEEALTSTTKGKKRPAKEVAETQSAKKPRGRGRKKVDEDEKEVESVKADSDDEEEESGTSTKAKKIIAKEVAESQSVKKPRGRGRKKAVEDEEEVESVNTNSDDEESVAGTKGRKRTAKEVVDSQPAKKPRGRGRKKAVEDEEEVESVKANSDDEEEESVASTKGRKRTAKVVAAKKPSARGRKKVVVEEVDDVEEEEIESVKPKRGKKTQKVEEVEEVPVATKKATRKRIFTTDDLNVISETANGNKSEEPETLRKSARTRK